MEETPDNLRGKVFGFVMALLHSCAALGMAGGGFLLEASSLKGTTTGSSLLIFLGILLIRKRKKGASGVF